MGKDLVSTTRRNVVIALAILMALVIVWVFLFVDKPITHERTVKIQVCEVLPKLIVVIDETDFNPKVYSKNLDDCSQ